MTKKLQLSKHEILERYGEVVMHHYDYDNATFFCKGTVPGGTIEIRVHHGPRDQDQCGGDIYEYGVEFIPAPTLQELHRCYSIQHIEAYSLEHKS